MENVDFLNNLLDDYAYMCFGFSEDAYVSGCFGRKHIMGEKDSWKAYTQGRAVEIGDVGGTIGVPLILEGERLAGFVDERAVVIPGGYRGDEWEFNNMSFSLALAGEHKRKNGWHMFYFSGRDKKGLFDRTLNYFDDFQNVNLRCGLCVLPGRENIQKLVDTREKYAAEYGKRDLPMMQVLQDALLWPPTVQELDAMRMPIICLPNKKEFDKSLEELRKRKQLKLPLA